MAKTKKEEPKIVDISAPATPLSPLFSNIVDIRTHKEVVMLDFGFIGPNYSDPKKIEMTQISRLCLPWMAIEFLYEQLNDVITEYNKKRKPKIKKKKKVNEV